ncbi:MAG: OsmC family peroxiredoxin [Promethearchaeota archaeon]|nr:MAG: OsmC family peroxiredoxin [Candidatus Lokiarchaeota archaeon]
MGKEIVSKVQIQLEKDMIFKCELGNMKVEECYIDDTHDVEEEMWGPNPARLLGIALLRCLSASFIFCLKKRDFTTEDLEATGEVVIGRNDKGFVRVKRVDVVIDVKVEGEEMRKRAEQCKKMFEQYCTVTAAVKEGIEINVDVQF